MSGVSTDFGGSSGAQSNSLHDLPKGILLISVRPEIKDEQITPARSLSVREIRKAYIAIIIVVNQERILDSLYALPRTQCRFALSVGSIGSLNLA